MSFSIFRATETDEIIEIFYSALNFKDVLLATGKLRLQRIDAPPTAPSTDICIEFSGLAGNKRVMGVSRYGGGLSLQGRATKDLTWEIPDYWSLEDAATIPVAYVTVSTIAYFTDFHVSCLIDFT